MSRSPAAGGTLWTARLALANSIGFSATTILPLWIAALPTLLHVPAWHVGLAGTLQLVTCGLGNLATPWLTARRDALPIARAALTLSAIGCLGEGLALATGQGSLFLFVACALVSGGGLGVLLAMTNRIMAGSDHAQHGYALFQIVEVCFASSLFVAGARLVEMLRGGALFLVAAAICMAGLAALHRLREPVRAARQAGDAARGRSHRLGGVLLLAGMLCFFSGQSSINSFLIPIGGASGLAVATVAKIVGAGMVFALVGATAARLVGERFGTIRPLAVVVALMAIDFVTITSASSPIVFALGAALVPSGTIFVAPYFFTALARVDAQGRFASLGPAFLIGGVSMGPLIASLVGHADGYGRLGGVAAVLAAFGIVMASSGMRVSRSHGRQAARGDEFADC